MTDTNTPALTAAEKLEAARARITRATIEALLAARRPDLAIDEINGSKGYYRKDAGPAASFRGGFKSWRQIAQALELIEAAE